MDSARPPSVMLALSGGVALGVYQAGAYAALHAHAHLRPAWLAGCSIGPVNAALIAGNSPTHRVERLHRFWRARGRARCGHPVRCRTGPHPQ
ncbi:hypothetical protein CH341_09515 [Rhodoplanes roseus]|uniref:PNPLA domain-containing protein n=2 Tax=Rhodoplanes roseus TaxID=29409 RepID=A0A327L4E2_9BRAD|nr:hypothetical protein CH341_09515 [Rhodoplanes roseus]